MNFDRLAPFYRVMEDLSAGGKLQRCRTAFLHDIPAPQAILLAGEGHGRSLPEFFGSFPEAEITVVDFSDRMLQIARNQFATPSPRVHFVKADLLTWDGPLAKYDLIVTYFFLDCFREEQLSALVSKLGSLALPRANWLLADFEIPGSGPARWRSQAILGLLYGFFRLVCSLDAKSLVCPDAFLSDEGFFRRARKTWEWGLLKSERWERNPKTLIPAPEAGGVAI